MLRPQKITLSLATLVVATLAWVAPARAERPANPAPLNPEVTLCVQPLGDFDSKMLPAIERGIAYLYGFEVRRLPHLPLPAGAYYKPRKRYRADSLLDYLPTITGSASCTYIVGFTHRDISVTKGEHKDWGVLGLGEVGGRVAMVSTWRVGRKLRKPHTRTRRTVKVVNHEIGHILGLPHVKGEGCLMNDAEGTVLTVDSETGLLCAPTIAYIEERHGYKVPRHERFEWKRVE